MMTNPLLDKEFLRELDQQKEREIFARVVSLNFREEPIEEITGRVTQGSVNVDGNSAVRRTCSVSMVAEELNIHDYYWGLNTKFQLFVGLTNNVDSRYPDIIWFPQGTYLISSFNTSQSISNYTISLQGKDKMCMLNGEIGGTVTALSVDFGQVDRVQEDGSIITEKYLIKNIIRDAVHTYAQEPYQNIIINDLDEMGAELMEYRGETAMYFLVNNDTHEVINMTMNGAQGGYYYKRFNKTTKQYDDWSKDTIAVGALADDEYDARTDYLDVDTYPTYLRTFGADGQPIDYTVIRATEGMTIGYRMTGLTYAGDLVIQVGGTITQMLDKIKAMLGDFEYFYDLQGHFVFQRKRTFINQSWNNIRQNEDSETWVDPVAVTSGVSYNFENANIITSFSNAPNLANLKNDFSIWGSRKGITGQEIAIHLRYAIDKKPTYYTTINGITYTTRTEEQVEQDRAEMEYELPKGGYQKEPSRFGLSEDWWEVRDWAKAWEFSGLDVPTRSLGTYCPIKAKIYPEGGTPPSSGYGTAELYPVDKDTWDSWGYRSGFTSDDIIFKPDGTIWSYHGGCAHSYTQWLNYFDPGGQYYGGYAYFYKPQVPADELGSTPGGGGLLLGDQIHYESEWRELIYQMALDYMEYGNEDDFLIRVREKNMSFYPTGYTGYEQYYTDILGFWRTLYNPTYLQSFETAYLTKSKFNANPGDYYIPMPIADGEKYDKNKQYVKKIVFGSYEPVTLTKEGFENIQDISIFYWLKQCDKTMTYDAKQIYFVRVTGEYDETSGWHTSVLEAPETLNFWFDFLDARDGTLANYACYNVGNRPKSENDSNVKAIYFRDTPNVIFVDSTVSDEEMEEMHEQKTGHTFIKLPTVMENLFTISSQGKSAFDQLNSHLYNFAYCTESISINALPVYYLEPNTRIFVKDENSGIEGEYIINRISIPLQYQGTMSISATKVVERLY